MPHPNFFQAKRVCLAGAMLSCMMLSPALARADKKQ